jgi:thiamine-monophosphate kinase
MPWFATMPILVFVGLGVNPGFRASRDRLCKPVNCAKVQVSEGILTFFNSSLPESVSRQKAARPMSPSKQSEDQLLDRILKRAGVGSRLAASRLAVGIGDDAALFRPAAQHETILTCDWFLEGIHFVLEKHPPDNVGWKCLARAVSDIAAMGGVPRCFLLSLALPTSRTGTWLNDFLSGLRRATRFLGCELAGGDTTRHEQVLINVTVIGEIAKGLGISRSGARPGDSIFVSGCLGEAERGLRRALRGKGRFNTRAPYLQKHLYPEPRLAMGQWLAKNRLATAMMDLSDGLSSDLPRLCQASGAGALIDSALIPTPPGLLASEALELGLHGGDDYELLFTVAPRNVSRIPGKLGGVTLTKIGEISGYKKILLRKGNKSQPLRPAGWDPFRKK